VFQISSQPLHIDQLRNSLIESSAGAFVSFEGWVRDHNDGQDVVLLEYEAFEALAVSEANQIIQEAKDKFGIINASCVHRVGALAVGDIAVWIGVVSGHRGAAFDACRYLIDEIKTRLPIWKRETYRDGSSGWVNCQSHSHGACEKKSDASYDISLAEAKG